MTLETPASLTPVGNEERGILRWESHGAQVALSTAYVRAYFCKEATPHEALGFMRFCEAHQLNPFLQDAYLVKYDRNETAQIVIAAHTWTKRASIDPQYSGHKVGIIVSTAEGFERRDSLFYSPGEEVVGGWAEVYLKDGATYRTELPIQERIAYKRDGTVTKFWKSMPATMISKCARADCMRAAFPVLFAGAYDQAEIAATHDALEGGLIVDAKFIDVDTGEIQDASPGVPEPEMAGAQSLDTETEAKAKPDPVAEGEPFPSDAEQILTDAVGPPSGDTMEAWDLLAVEMESEGLTVEDVLPPRCADFKAFEALGGTVTIGRIRLKKAVEQRQA